MCQERGFQLPQLGVGVAGRKEPMPIAFFTCLTTTHWGGGQGVGQEGDKGRERRGVEGDRSGRG